MARGKTIIKRRKIGGDPLYNNIIVSKLINRAMKDGKKSVVQKQVYNAFSIIEKTGKKPLEAFLEAMKNLSPQVEVRARRIGGAAYQVPAPVRAERKTSLALRWLVTEARKRPNKEYRTFADKLAAELLDALKNEGGAIKKKETVHKMAEANRAFSHFRW